MFSFITIIQNSPGDPTYFNKKEGGVSGQDGRVG